MGAVKVQCSNCGGTGLVLPYLVSVNTNARTVTHSNSCPKCNGQGFIFETRIMETKKEEKKTFLIKVEGNFVPTTSFVKQRLGLGFNVLSVEQAREFEASKITDAESAAKAIVYTGHRELVRRHHPDGKVCSSCGGSGITWQGAACSTCPITAAAIININQGKKQLDELMKAVEAMK